MESPDVYVIGDGTSAPVFREMAGTRGRLYRPPGGHYIYDAEAEEKRTEDEDFRPVPAFPHTYLVSSYGRVWSVRGSRFLRPQVNEDGYFRVDLRSQGERWNAFVQHVVLSAYQGARPEEHQAHHLNGDQQDNRVSNLRWIEREIHEAYQADDELAVDEEPAPLADEAPF